MLRLEFTWELLVQLALVRISMLLRTKWTLSNLAPASVGCIAPEVVSDRATPSSKTRPTSVGTKRSSLIFFLPKPTKNLILARLIFFICPLFAISAPFFSFRLSFRLALCRLRPPSGDSVECNIEGAAAAATAHVFELPTSNGVDASTKLSSDHF